MYTKEELAKALKDAVEWCIDEDMGCVTLKFDDKLGVCVGWLPGYGEEKRDDVIQSKGEPDFAINAGIKVYTSDDMRTDYEFINMPFYDNGDVLATDVSIEPNEDYDKLAEYFLKEYDNMKDLEIEEDGHIVENKDEVEEAVNSATATSAGNQEDLKQLSNDLSEHFADLNVYYDIWWDDDSILVDIDWGDWKHDHLWCDYEVEHFLNSRGYEVLSHDTEVTDEDGSDTYSATHSYKVKKTK